MTRDSPLLGYKPAVVHPSLATQAPLSRKVAELLVKSVSLLFERADAPLDEPLSSSRGVTHFDVRTAQYADATSCR